MPSSSSFGGSLRRRHQHRYASLYASYQCLRNNMDDWEEEMRCDLVDTENELRRVKAELQRTKDENQELRRHVEELTAKLEAQAAK